MKLRTTLTALLAAGAGPALAAAATAGTPAVAVGDAHVSGTFAMAGRITRAVDVRGEHRGASVRRTWTITGLHCGPGGVCAVLRVRRERPGASPLTVLLHRVGPGRYRGSGSFASPLRCLGRTYARGLDGPYTLTVTVTGRTAVDSVLYATAIRAGYDNPRRTNRTPCPLAPASDAARYSGRLTSALPTSTGTISVTTTLTAPQSTTAPVPPPTTTTAPATTTTTPTVSLP